MIYLWETPIKFLECEDGDDLNRYVGIYNREIGPNHVLFNSGLSKGSIWNFSKDELVFNFATSILEILKYDVLENDSSFIIVNQRIKKILEFFAHDDLQFVPVTVKCINGSVDGYYAVNILSRVSGIDKNKSTIEWGPFDNDPYMAGFGTGVGGLVYNHNCLSKHHMAIEEEFPFILVSQQLKDALCSMKPPVNDVRFVLPEETEW